MVAALTVEVCGTGVPTFLGTDDGTRSPGPGVWGSGRFLATAGAPSARHGFQEFAMTVTTTPARARTDPAGLRRRGSAGSAATVRSLTAVSLAAVMAWVGGRGDGRVAVGGGGDAIDSRSRVRLHRQS